MKTILLALIGMCFGAAIIPAAELPASLQVCAVAALIGALLVIAGVTAFSRRPAPEEAAGAEQTQPLPRLDVDRHEGWFLADLS
jgi:hypothetical protein